MRFMIKADRDWWNGRPRGAMKRQLSVFLVEIAVIFAGLESHRFTWTRIQRTLSVALRATAEWQVVMRFHGSGWTESSVTKLSRRSSALTFGTLRLTCRLTCRRRRRRVLTGTRIIPTVDRTQAILSRAPSRSTTSVWHVSPFSRCQCVGCYTVVHNKCNQIKQNRSAYEKNRTIHYDLHRGTERKMAN